MKLYSGEKQIDSGARKVDKLSMLEKETSVVGSVVCGCGLGIGRNESMGKICLEHPPNIMVAIDIAISVAISGQLSFYLSFSLNILSC